MRALALVLACSSCGDEPIGPNELRFGQIGRIEIVMETPLGQGEGALVQRLAWGGTGERTLQESISYGSLVGDESFTRLPLDSLDLSASAYVGRIQAFNEVEGEKLLDVVPTDVVPEACGQGRTRVTFRIVDEAKDASRTWIRCVDGSLGTVTPTDAGPDVDAARIAQAVVSVRDAILGVHFASRYAGSKPFGTLARGEDSDANLVQPETFTDSRSFQDFWSAHAGGTAPAVDFTKDMVVVALVGRRDEAGDSVEVRRILPVDSGTIIEYVERVPGNFCSPAAKSHVPFHIVVAPATPTPHRFSQLPREEVPCGG